MCVCVCLPSQYIWQQLVDEVLHALMLSGALQEKLEGFLVPAIIKNQTLQRRCHVELSGRRRCKYFHQQQDSL